VLSGESSGLASACSLWWPSPPTRFGPLSWIRWHPFLPQLLAAGSAYCRASIRHCELLGWNRPKRFGIDDVRMVASLAGGDVAGQAPRPQDGAARLTIARAQSGVGRHLLGGAEQGNVWHLDQNAGGRHDADSGNRGQQRHLRASMGQAAICSLIARSMLASSSSSASMIRPSASLAGLHSAPSPNRLRTL
jgi:hypothetical protein